MPLSGVAALAWAEGAGYGGLSDPFESALEPTGGPPTWMPSPANTVERVGSLGECPDRARATIAERQAALRRREVPVRGPPPRPQSARLPPTMRLRGP